MIRVLVVDDSGLIRRLICRALADDPQIEVVGQAADGAQALDRVRELRPDAVTLDIEMPVLDGLGALREIVAVAPQTCVVMFSTMTERGAAATLEALSHGAGDFVTKPSAASGALASSESLAASLASVRDELAPKIKALVAARRSEAPHAQDTRPPAEGTAARSQRPQVLLVGCSTGGPDALRAVLVDLAIRRPAGLPVPVLVVQHMPPMFTTMFAQRLAGQSGFDVREAEPDDKVEAGVVLVAPGDYHLRVRRDAGDAVRAVLDQEAKVNYCRPAVDPLWESAADAYGGAAVALLLTGMGHDGLAGARAVRAAGGRVLVQDRSSSVVWGMPGAVAEAGLADEVLPLGGVGAALDKLLPAGTPVR